MEIEHIKNQLLSHHQLPLQAHTLQKLPQNLGNKIQSPASILTLFCSSRLPWMLYRALLKQWRSWYGDPMQNAGWLTSQRVSWKECKDVLGNMVCFQPPMFPSWRFRPSSLVIHILSLVKDFLAFPADYIGLSPPPLWASPLQLVRMHLTTVKLAVSVKVGVSVRVLVLIVRVQLA